MWLSKRSVENIFIIIKKIKFLYLKRVASKNDVAEEVRLFYFWEFCGRFAILRKEAFCSKYYPKKIKLRKIENKVSFCDPNFSNMKNILTFPVNKMGSMDIRH